MTITVRPAKKEADLTELIGKFDTEESFDVVKEHDKVVVESISKVVLWTVGHSNRTIKYFVDLLKEHGIEVLVDVRRFPTSTVKHFKQEEMERWLAEHGIEYVWKGEDLGGYRRGGYKAYTKTEQFRDGIEKLLELARHKRVCIMCLEPNPKYCHRRSISAYLKRQGAKVVHILKKGQTSLMKFKDTIKKEQRRKDKNMHVSEFQGMMRRIYFHRDSKRGTVGTYEWLVEEIGELGEALKGENRKALEDEFADVLAWLASLANVVNIDLEKVALAKYNDGCPKCQQSPCKCPFRSP